MIRVRFAPSPTGYLHIGGARTALFNWLYARRHGGTFVLRIEDTDAERSSWDMVAGIVDGLRWLGLDWDEGPDVGGPHAPYFQSQRLDGSRRWRERWSPKGAPITATARAETLQAEAAGGGSGRRRLGLRPHVLRADGRGDRARVEAAGAPRAVRFKVPAGTTSFDDLVHGPIAFDNANIEDFVVLRSDGQPTYHLSVVADDIDMEITHVVRGDDHISNTPKQVLLYQAFGATPPQFAHVPLILGPDKKRLSKRHGATSVMEYQRHGLPAGGDGEFSRAARLVARRRPRAVHPRRARSRRSRSKASAAATPCSIRRSSTGSTSSTSCGSRLTSWPLRIAPILARAGIYGTTSFWMRRREWLHRACRTAFVRASSGLPQFAEELRPFLQETSNTTVPQWPSIWISQRFAPHLKRFQRHSTRAGAPFDAPMLEDGAA